MTKQQIEKAIRTLDAIERLQEQTYKLVTAVSRDIRAPVEQNDEE